MTQYNTYDIKYAYFGDSLAPVERNNITVKAPDYATAIADFYKEHNDGMYAVINCKQIPEIKLDSQTNLIVMLSDLAKSLESRLAVADRKIADLEAKLKYYQSLEKPRLSREEYEKAITQAQSGKQQQPNTQTQEQTHSERR